VEGKMPSVRLHRSICGRRKYLQIFIEEIRNAASCLGACEAAIYKEELGLRAEQWKALAAIHHSTFTLSISDLARHLRCRRQSAHSLVLGLARAGWVHLLPNPDDRRLIQIELVSSRRAALMSVEARLSHWLLMMTFDLGDNELIKLVRTLRSVRGRIARSREHA
jgi:DNA-binding MarR family transcriptional regulator